MFSIDPAAKKPIYMQIIDQVVLLVSSGLLAEGDQLPSIRDLAGQLGINPNTVARAYRELESMQLILSIPKKGSYVAKGDLEKEMEERAKHSLQEWIRQCDRMGLKRERSLAIAKEVLRAENH